MKKLPDSFFERRALVVARELVGKTLARNIDRCIVRHKIVETEAYAGEHDLASHSSRGKTLRNTPMYERGGTIYVYFTYGIHWMLNISTGKKGSGEAVLIRGTSEVSGPARLTKALKIDKSLNGLRLGQKSGLWIEDAPNISREDVRRTPRIGVSSAKDGWAEKPYRFILKQ